MWQTKRRPPNDILTDHAGISLLVMLMIVISMSSVREGHSESCKPVWSEVGHMRRFPVCEKERFPANRKDLCINCNLTADPDYQAE